MSSSTPELVNAIKEIAALDTPALLVLIAIIAGFATKRLYFDNKDLRKENKKERADCDREKATLHGKYEECLKQLNQRTKND